jgi:hypothetical protein
VSTAKIRCREIADPDLDAIANLLTRGFVGRPRDYWVRGLRRQGERAVPDGYPRYGYLLENQGTPVGVLLLLFSVKAAGQESSVCCNVSSWYVEPLFRSYAPLLAATALRHKHVTYINVTPAPPTWPIIEAQGFQRYCSGLFLSFPFLSRTISGGTIDVIAPDGPPVVGLARSDLELLSSHAHYGCLSVVCRAHDGAAYPFVLTPLRIRRGRIALPMMQLAYCRDTADFVRCAGTLDRFLLRRGQIAVALDSNGPVPGLLGFYTEAYGRKYFKGPHRPRLADLADTELVLYGF